MIGLRSQPAWPGICQFRKLECGGALTVYESKASGFILHCYASECFTDLARSISNTSLCTTENHVVVKDGLQSHNSVRELSKISRC